MRAGLKDLAEEVIVASWIIVTAWAVRILFRDRAVHTLPVKYNAILEENNINCTYRKIYHCTPVWFSRTEAI